MVEELKIVALDSGYGNIKAMDNKGNKIIFPTLIKPYFKKVDQDTSEFKHIVTINRKTFAIGEFASIGTVDRTPDREQQLDFEKISVFLGTALNLLSDDEASRIQHISKLGVGLPIDFYAEQKGKLESLLKGLEIETEINGKNITFVIENVIVAQQGTAAFLDLFLNPDGSIKDESDEKFSLYGGGIVDIGFNTIDYARIKKQQKFVLSDTESGSFESLGIIYAHKKATDCINNYLGAKYDTVTLENALKYQDGNLYVAGKEVNVKNFFQEAYQAMANEIKIKLLKEWKDVDSFGSLYLTGGGSEKIYPYFKIQGVDVKLQNDPVFANCRGYIIKLCK